MLPNGTKFDFASWISLDVIFDAEHNGACRILIKVCIWFLIIFPISRLFYDIYHENGKDAIKKRNIGNIFLKVSQTCLNKEEKILIFSPAVYKK